MDVFDANGDGRVTAAEKAAAVVAASRRGERDGVNDEVIEDTSLIDRAPTPAASVFASAVQSVSHEECLSKTNNAAECNDDNNDGRIDAAEFEGNQRAIAKIRAAFAAIKEGYLGYLALYVDTVLRFFCAPAHANALLNFMHASPVTPCACSSCFSESFGSS